MTSLWLLKDSSALTLTANEQEWFDWAVSGAQEVLDDESWLEDNKDALTPAGQIADLHYRLEEQGPDVAETDASTEQLRGRKRSLSSLLKKLDAAGYWNESYHSR